MLTFISITFALAINFLVPEPEIDSDENKESLILYSNYPFAYYSGEFLTDGVRNSRLRIVYKSSIFGVIFVISIIGSNQLLPDNNNNNANAHFIAREPLEILEKKLMNSQDGQETGIVLLQHAGKTAISTGRGGSTIPNNNA